MGYEPTGKDMNSYIEDYLEHIAGYRGLSDATVKTYVQDLGTFMNFLEMMEVGDLRNVNRRTVRGFWPFWPTKITNGLVFLENSPYLEDFIGGW